MREMSVWTWWDRLGQDLRYALRGFRRSPAFAATAVLSLALGIGANTAIFSILNTLMLRPLPVRDPSTLFQVVHSGDGGVSESSTYALYEHLKTHAKTIAGTFQVNPTSTMRVLVDGQADAVVGQQVTGDYFNVLGIRPVIGSRDRASRRTRVDPQPRRGPRPRLLGASVRTRPWRPRPHDRRSTRCRTRSSASRLPNSSDCRSGVASM